MPYKGVDAVVDALSAHLRRRSELEVASLRPRHLGPLVQIFPILADVWSLKGSPVRRFEPLTRSLHQIFLDLTRS